MKHILLLCFILAGTALYAQDCNTLTALRKGTRIVNSTYNANDKFEGKAVMEVKDITSDGGDKTWNMHTESYGSDNNLEHEGDANLVCEGGVLKIDISNMFKEAGLDQEGIDIEIDNDKIEIPSNLTAGQTLSESKLEMTMKREGTEAGKVIINITDRQVDDKQQLEVPAGAYEVYKISYDMEVTMTMMGMALPGTTMKIVEYFSPEIGSVKTETYTEKDKLQTYTVLTEFTR